MKETFKSVSNNQIGYCLIDGADAPWTSHKPDHWLASSMFVFDTFGDGNCQHSLERLATAKDAEDLFLSLATHIISHIGDWEQRECNDISYSFPDIGADKLAR